MNKGIPPFLTEFLNWVMQTYEYLEMKYVIFARETLPNDDDNVLKKPFG